MNMKKTLALLAALSTMAAFTGCGDSSSTAEESSKETTTSATQNTTTAATTTTTAETTPAPVLEVDANAITFDTASLYTAHCMNEDGFQNGEAECKLTIEEYNGDPKMRVQVLTKGDDGNYAIPKLVWNLPELLGVENMDKIGHISMDITCVAKDTWKNEDGTESLVVGNFLGALAGNLAAEKGTDADGNITQNTWAQYDYALQDWENAEHTWRVETDIPFKGLPINGFAANDESCTLVLMRWAQLNQVDFYIDNITFLDKDGKSMEIIYDAAANPAGAGDASGSDETKPAGGDTADSTETTTENTAAAE